MAQESKTFIATTFEEILRNYRVARVEPFGRENRTWRLFETLANFFQAHVSKSRPSLVVKASAGKGNWARVPWIAFLDDRETHSTKYGVYPVYLFREDMSGVYVTLNQGVTRLKERHGIPESRRILEERAKELRRELPSLQTLKEVGFSVDDKIDLHTSRGLGKDYEGSTICYKLYVKGAIPNDDEIADDLEQVLRAYDQYLESSGLRFVDTSLVSDMRDVEEPIEPRMPASPQPDFKIATAIHEVISYIADRGFIYEPWQVAQYITAVRTKPFVILAGITGTGKSKLPKLIAEATGGESKLVPVRPDWTDSADVLGYKDLQGNFQPGPLLELASVAAARSDQFYTCIIDEMNLARVEQYFAEVLSRLEDRHPLERGGYGTDAVIEQVRKADAEWGEVSLPSNLAIVGTVNMDESTHGFSRKVLDRAFTIELSDVDLSDWNPNGARVRDVSTWPVSSWNPIKIRLNELENPTAEQTSEITRAIAALNAVNVILTPSQLQVGYRTRDEVAFYLLHAQQISDAFVDRKENAVDPLDLALQMKILPRIAGSSNAIKRCVSGLLGWATTGVPVEDEDAVNSIIESWEQSGRESSLPNSKYPRLAARLCWMWQRLVADGYTSYWL